jgi:hypothetical protein
MLAAAGRRYLLSLINTVHSIASIQPSAGELPGPPNAAVVVLQHNSVPHVSLPVCAGLQHLVAPLQPIAQQEWCASSYTTSAAARASSTSDDSSSSQQPVEQAQQQQQQQQSDVTPLVDAQQSGDNIPPVASFSGRPIQQQPPMAAMGARRVDPSVFAGSKAPRAKREGVVHVNSTFNNTHLVLTDRASKVEAWVSGGTVGYKNANKVRDVSSCQAVRLVLQRHLAHSPIDPLHGVSGITFDVGSSAGTAVLVYTWGCATQAPCLALHRGAQAVMSC